MSDAKKSQAEVTADFVKGCSFILNKALGKAVAGAKGKGKARVAAVKGDPLWDTKKFEEGQFLSQLAYYTVTKIAPEGIDVVNQFGDEFTVSKDILEKMYSADHY